MSTPLGDRLRHLRHLDGLSQRQVADRVGGITGQAICHIETSDRPRPGFALVVRLARLYDEPLDDLAALLEFQEVIP